MRTLRVFTVLLLLAVPALAKPDAAHEKKADEAIKKMLAFLRSKQNPDGSWSTRAGPAITSMVVSAMLEQPGIDKDDAHVAKGVAYVLSKVQKDGSIHDGILQNYNTSICLAMLAKLGNDPKIKEVVENGRKYLKDSQYHEGMKDAKGNPIDKNHPWYGGTGYGTGGRPDGSNTHITIEAFMETGSDCKDPEIVAAVEFFTRLQGTKANKAGGGIVQDGGAVYTPATAEKSDEKGKGKGGSGAGEVVDADGKSRLRTYGSMTYAMFKTYVYAQLPKDDQRVIDAKKWIANNYTVEYNPGMPDAQKWGGYYYYLLTFSRALDANKEDVIVDAKGAKHNWANDLIGHLVKLQKEDGSFANEFDRFMEGDVVMVTAMALTSMSAARY
jgi:squalene-hopene/tetraprenyl-beta-curcumene cyclase